MTDKKYITRLSTVEGHIRGIKQMVENNKCCEEIIMQIYAAESALKKIAKEIIKKHLSSCVVEAVKRGDTNVVEEFGIILDRYI